MKKIAVIVKYFYPVAAGIETNTLETYSVLAAKGWDVQVHTSTHTLSEEDALPPLQQYRKLTIHRYPHHWYWPQIDWMNTDVVAIHNFDVSFVWILLFSLYLQIRHRKRFSLFITPHGGFTPEWSIFPLVPRTIKWLYHRSLGALLINLVADGVRAVSLWEQKEIEKYGVNPSKITVISNGLENEAFQDVDKFASANAQKLVTELGKYIIQIGRIYPIKNYETVIRALPLVNQDLKFLIIGPVADPAYKDSLVSLAHRLGVGDRVIFGGIVRGIDKYYLIRHAKAMVHMAIWESFCNVVHEALSQGTPVIAADNTALRFLVSSNKGFLVPTRDHIKVADRLQWILAPANSQTLSQMAKKNINTTHNQTWSSTAQKMNDWYLSQTHENTK